MASSYCLGGFLGGRIVSLLKGINLRKRGSRSMGATNVLRTMGPIYAVGTLIIDIGKGVCAVALGRWLTHSNAVEVICGLLAIVGHNWPVSTAFRGGKGMATTCGVLILLAPKALIVLVPLWAVISLATGFVSLGSIVAATALPLAIVFLPPVKSWSPWLLVFGVLGAAMAVYQHRANITRLWRGNEHNLWRRKKETI